MADIFDQINSEQGDIFDQVAEPAGVTPTGITSVPWRAEGVNPEVDAGVLARTRKALAQPEQPEEGKTWRRYIGKPTSILGRVEAAKGWHEVDIEPEAAYVKQAFGAMTRGGMRVGQAVLEAPKHTAWLAGNMMELGPGGQRLSFAEVAEQFGVEKAAARYEEVIKLHKEGRESILRNHPDWETDPPDSFLDLLTSPRKLSLALIESIPLMIAAGVLTAAGRPDLSMGMIYTSEGQVAYDMAKAEGRSDAEAEYLYHTYGSVATVIEQYLHINPAIKLGKGAYSRVLARTVHKAARTGKKVGKGTLLSLVQETIEEPLQNAWQEVSANSVYGKEIPGGAAGFIDRTAQNALMGLAMGLVPIAGGASVGFVSSGKDAGGTVSDTAGDVVDDTVSDTEDPTGGSQVMPEGVATLEANEDLSPEQVNRAVETEQQAWDVQHGGRNVANLENEMRSLVDQVEGEKDTGRLAKLADQMETLDTEIERIKENNVRGKGISDLHKLAKKQGIKVPKGTKRSSIIKLLQGSQDVVRTEGGFIARSLVTKGPAGSAWNTEVFPTYEDAVAFLLEERARQNLMPIDETQSAQADEIEDQDIGLNETTESTEAPTPAEISSEVTNDLQEATGVESAADQPAQPRSNRALLYLGHDLPAKLGIDEESRKALMVEVTGKDSMKKMSPAEKELFVSTLEEQANAAGIDQSLPVVEQIVDRLDKLSKKADLSPTQELHEGNLKGLKKRIKKWGRVAYDELMRMERIIESLDGEESGPLRENIWLPTKKADGIRTNTVTARTEELVRWITEDYGLDIAEHLGRVEEISPGVELTGSERIGVYMLAQNENGKRYLNEGMEISDDDIVTIAKSLSDNERAYGDKLLEEYHSQWPVIQVLAAELGMDPKLLQEELQYSPILRKDVDPSEQIDFLDMMLDSFTQDSFRPGQGFLEERKQRAMGKIELDSTIIYLNNVRRVETFKAMAPVAKKVGGILRNRSFQKSLNNATYNNGVRLFNTWFKDTVKGYSSVSNGWFGKQLSILRRNGIVYAIGYNIPSSLRQTLSLSNAMAVNPRMLKHIPINLNKATVDFNLLEEEVLGKSALVRSRDFERDLRQKWDRESLKRKLGGKRALSERATAWIRWMDKHTVVVAWKSLYDTATELGKNEKDAVEYADKWVGRTQPMANAKDLPQFFRDGDLAKLVSTFQNQINNNFNFYTHDIVRARAKGDITNTEVAYRVMFSWILPAIAFGMIGRGGLPKTWKQLVTDIVTYPIASIMLVGRIINAAILGWGNSSSVVETGPEAAVRALTDIRNKKYIKAIKNAAIAVAAVKGYPAAQPIRTISGAHDLATGETQDPRRLIWSEWALKQGEEPSGSTSQRTTRRSPRTRTRRRRP